MNTSSTNRKLDTASAIRKLDTTGEKSREYDFQGQRIYIESPYEVYETLTAHRIVKDDATYTVPIPGRFGCKLTKETK